MVNKPTLRKKVSLVKAAALFEPVLRMARYPVSAIFTSMTNHDFSSLRFLSARRFQLSRILNFHASGYGSAFDQPMQHLSHTSAVGWPCCTPPPSSTWRQWAEVCWRGQASTRRLTAFHCPRPRSSIRFMEFFANRKGLKRTGPKTSGTIKSCTASPDGRASGNINSSMFVPARPARCAAHHNGH